MEDKEMWLILYQAILSSDRTFTSDEGVLDTIEYAAHTADAALKEYKKRWVYEDKE